MNRKDYLLVCLYGVNFPVEKYIYICCNYDIKLKKCGNYMICNYKTKTEYTNGFQNQYRNHIAFIKNESSIVFPNEKLIIEANTNIEIYFHEPITDLSYFFSVIEDSNTRNIKLIDLSHFDSSSITKTLYMFQQCVSLEEINFNNFKTSKVIDMSCMFQE